MARTTLRRAVEAKIRKKIQQNNAGMLWLLQDFRSPYEGLAKLSLGSHSVPTGRSIRKCIESTKCGPHAADAIDLLVWIYADVISRYCSNVGGWYRKDAEQEGLLAIIEVAKKFKMSCFGDRHVPEGFRKAVIRHIRVARRKESRQAEISDEFLAFINVGFQLGEKMETISKRAIKPSDVHEYNEIIALLRDTVDTATLSSGLEPWASRHLHGRSIARYVKEDVDANEASKATAKMQRRALRLHRRLRKVFKNHGLEMVAIESLWLAGKACNDSVAMVSLRASNGDGAWQDRRTIKKA